MKFNSGFKGLMLEQVMRVKNLMRSCMNALCYLVMYIGIIWLLHLVWP